MRKVLSIVLVLTTAISLSISGCRRDKKPALEERTKVEDEISHLKNENGNIYINEKKEYEKIVSYLLGEVEKSNFRGSLIVATDDEVIFASGTHLLDIDGNEVTPETVYEIGSLTKSFVAVCTMKLVEEGTLSLDDTLGKFFPQYTNCPNYEKTSKVKIYDLLHMRSGLPDYLNAPELFFDEETIDRGLGWHTEEESAADERTP